MKPTQRSILLQVLQSRGRSGVFVYELMAPKPQGLGIAQYGARILELRRQGFDIRNDQPGHFYLFTNPTQEALSL